jgi:hypothetical protein
MSVVCRLVTENVNLPSVNMTPTGERNAGKNAAVEDIFFQELCSDVKRKYNGAQ